MSKAFKKLTGLLLAVLMVVTMIPVMGGRAAAEEAPAFSLYVNGQPTGKSVTREWMEENKMQPQIFPFAGQKNGGKFAYYIAEGPSYEAVLNELTGANSLADLTHTAIRWNNASGAEEGMYDLDVSDLQKATVCFKLVDFDGNDIQPKDFANNANVMVAALKGAATITPIVACTASNGQKSYEDATALLEGDWRQVTSIQPYVGGNPEKEPVLKENNTTNGDSVNYTGKFALTDCPQLNLKIAVPTAATSALSFTNTTPKKATFSEIVTDKEKELFFTGETIWESSDKTVATVDQAGTVKPAGKIGSCIVKKKGVLKSGGEPVELGRCTVKVDQSAFAPAKPVGLKVKNIKKRTAKLTWKKAANATGYIVYRSKKKNKGYKKIKTLTKLSYKNKKLKRGKTYYYKIKAYRKYQGHTIYSPLTAAKKVKIKK